MTTQHLNIPEITEEKAAAMSPQERLEFIARMAKEGAEAESISPETTRSLVRVFAAQRSHIVHANPRASKAAKEAALPKFDLDGLMPD